MGCTRPAPPPHPYPVERIAETHAAYAPRQPQFDLGIEAQTAAGGVGGSIVGWGADFVGSVDLSSGFVAVAAGGFHSLGLVRADRELNPIMTRTIALSVPVAIATGSGSETAIRITMVDLQNPNPANLSCCPPPDFSAYESGTCTAPGESNGCARWVGKPGMFHKSQGNHALGQYRAARLQCTPFYHDWSGEGLIHVVGAEIVPSSTYRVAYLAVTCKGTEDTCTDLSTMPIVSTARFGDITAPFNPPATSTQPDALDVAQLVNKLKNVVGAPIKAIAQLQPNLPELNADVSVLDIVACVDALKGFAYNFGGPCPCPSTVPCGPAMGSVACADPAVCVTAFGPESMCVKTCVGGTNDGEPCIKITHCQGGTSCGNAGPNPGYCRDRCGRCRP